MYIRREAEMGRYHSMNLLTGEWIEVMMDRHKENVIGIYRQIRETFLLQPIY